MEQPFPTERRKCSTDSRVCYISGCHPLYKGIKQMMLLTSVNLFGIALSNPIKAVSVEVIV